MTDVSSIDTVHLVKKSRTTRSKNQGIAFVPILIIIGLVVAGALIAPKFIKKSSPTTVGEQTSTPGEPGWETYRNAKFGYSVKHPEGWTVDDSQFEKIQEIMIVESGKNAYVKVNAYQDRGVNSQETVSASIAEFKQKIENTPDMKLTQFKDSFEGDVGGYIALGQQTIAGVPFAFENRGLLATNGRVLIFHGAYKASEPSYGEIIRKIILSFALDKD